MAFNACISTHLWNHCANWDSAEPGAKRIRKKCCQRIDDDNFVGDVSFGERSLLVLWSCFSVDIAITAILTNNLRYGEAYGSLPPRRQKVFPFKYMKTSFRRDLVWLCPEHLNSTGQDSSSSVKASACFTLVPMFCVHWSLNRMSIKFCGAH